MRPLEAQGQGAANEFNDSHFHLTNYIQQGIDVRQFLEIMGTRVGRSTLFGIPLQQQWSYANSGEFAPTYYLQSDAPLYYYSFTDAYIASVYRSLSPERAGALRPDDHGLQPGRHVRRRPHPPRAARRFPGVFTGIGEFSIHKEFVSAKVAGETASLTNPALDRILDFAAEVGLVVILHNDIDMPFAKDGHRAGVSRADQGGAQAPSDASIIWAHTGLGRDRASGAGLGRSGRAAADALEMVEAMLADPAAHARATSTSRGTRSPSTRSSSPRSSARVAAMLNKSTPTASCSGPTRSRRRGPVRTSPCSTCGRRSGVS